MSPPGIVQIKTYIRAIRQLYYMQINHICGGRYMFNNFIDSFLHAATHYPGKPAIIFRDKTISYEELHQRSNDIAQHLLINGITPEEIIPLILERDPDTITAIIGILKAGGAFLPISPITPCSRIRFILDDTKANLVISNIDLDHMVDSKIKIIRPSDIKSSNNSVSTITAPSHLAYVMYTSGSTGNPKGVLIEHGSLMNLFSSLISEFHLTKKETILALTDYTFDISLIELLLPLLLGATIVLTEQGTVADGAKIKQYLDKYVITLMQATPLTWEILLKQGWKNDGLMRILVGGEKFRTRLAILLDYKNKNVWNMYGPTETSMWSMIYHLNGTPGTESVPLGKPLKNTLIQILDDKLNTVDLGVQGELYIGGQGLARGYLNNPDLTGKQFITHHQTQTRLYKTGDLVMAYDAQTLCYIGRTDDQLKFGGIRIEAGEIESVIEQEPFVKKALVKVHETEGYYKSLAAYVEVDEEQIFSKGIQTASSDVSGFLKNIYDETYLHAENYEHGVMNNCGWQSSFTGELISIEELDESCQFIRAIIKESDLTDVLEVGCGTGSLLLEYIDNAKACTIVEISSKALDYVKSRLSSEQQQKVVFKNESVLTIHTHQKFSCVIINSVIQYLPSIHALITALNQLISATQSSGTIIIGDVRSLELMEVYLLEKIRTNSLTPDDLQSNLSSFYYKSRDAEIVLSPCFFHALKKDIKEITQVDICVKHGACKNELNYFRYDVVLHINKPVVHASPLSIPYSPSLDSLTVQELMTSNPDMPIIVSNVPNVFLHDLLNTIDKEIPHHVPLRGSEPEIPFNNETRKQIESLLQFVPEAYEHFVLYDELNPLGALKLCLYPKSRHQMTRCLDTYPYKGYRSYCREPFNPWLQKFCFDHIKLKVSQHVVSWVNPSVYIWIEKWPLSINGKLDKKKLQLPANAENSSSDPGTIARLRTMWRNITGDNALVDKEFWVHGVSSLCMYFFLATINETFLVNINYHEFRDYNTLSKLASYIDQLLEQISS